MSIQNFECTYSVISAYDGCCSSSSQAELFAVRMWIKYKGATRTKLSLNIYARPSSHKIYEISIRISERHSFGFSLIKEREIILAWMLTVHGDIVGKAWMGINLSMIIYILEYRPYAENPTWHLYDVQLRTLGCR